MNPIKRPLIAGITTLAMATGLAGCAQYQSKPTPVASTQVPASDVGIGAPALWKVADEDTTIYIFGTVHTLPDDIDWYTGRVKNALDSSDTLVTEIDMTPEAMAQMPALVQSTAMLPAGTTVRSLMDDEELETYEGALAKLNVPVNALDQLEPWFAALTISQIAYQKAGFKEENGTENVLESVVGDTKGRGALETVQFQLSIFDGLPQDAQVDYLVETAEEVDNLGSVLTELVDEWSVGDVESLGDLLNEALESDPVLADRLLYARNANWAVWIDNRLDQPGTIFMAVGAGHLAGRESLQEKLAERGIQIARIQ